MCSFFNNGEPKILFQEAPLGNNCNKKYVRNKQKKKRGRHSEPKKQHVSKNNTYPIIEFFTRSSKHHFIFALLSTWFVPPQTIKWRSRGVAAVKKLKIKKNGVHTS